MQIIVVLGGEIFWEALGLAGVPQQGCRKRRDDRGWRLDGHFHANAFRKLRGLVEDYESADDSPLQCHGVAYRNAVVDIVSIGRPSIRSSAIGNTEPYTTGPDEVAIAAHAARLS